ncbi:MAG: gfo/Idh/MocA family oxidoreductase, partial [Verrucomicrobiae bacterium]|nr:gfo/Idh/MocA family oxidoreductase [Verrucomicrobiae bacterium]
PYHPHRVHNSFRGYWDYDGGGLGDMGQHYLDPCQFILGKDNESPVHVEVDTQKQHHDAVLPWRRIELTYADGTKIILNAETNPMSRSLPAPRAASCVISAPRTFPISTRSSNSCPDRHR